jgi:hypothetical protein
MFYLSQFHRLELSKRTCDVENAEATQSWGSNMFIVICFDFHNSLLRWFWNSVYCVEWNNTAFFISPLSERTTTYLYIHMVSCMQICHIIPLNSSKWINLRFSIYQHKYTYGTWASLIFNSRIDYQRDQGSNSLFQRSAGFQKRKKWRYFIDSIAIDEKNIHMW